MANQVLARLRLARVRCNEKIAALEVQLAYQRRRREGIEAAIHELEPELRLPATFLLATLAALGMEGMRLEDL